MTEGDCVALYAPVQATVKRVTIRLLNQILRAQERRCGHDSYASCRITPMWMTVTAARICFVISAGRSCTMPYGAG